MYNGYFQILCVTISSVALKFKWNAIHASTVERFKNSMSSYQIKYYVKLERDYYNFSKLNLYVCWFCKHMRNFMCPPTYIVNLFFANYIPVWLECKLCFKSKYLLFEKNVLVIQQSCYI